MAGHTIEKTSPRMTTPVNASHLLLLAACLVSLAAILWSLPVQAIFRWGSQFSGWRGAIAFLAAYIVFTLCLIPVWPMPVLAGAVFGAARGTVLSSLGCAAAASVSFLVARAVGRTKLAAKLATSPRLRALEKSVQAGDWKIVAAVRLSHFMTFGMQNYAFGLTRITFRNMLLTTWLVTLPGTWLQAYIGDLGYTSLRAWRSESLPGWQSWSLQIVGLCLVASAVVYLGYRIRRDYQAALKQELERELSREDAAGTRRRNSRTTWMLTGLAGLLAVLATTCVLNRESIRNSIERFAAAAQEGTT